MFLLKDYLVILAGSPRGGETTWSSLYKYVTDYLDADLAICCSDKWNQNISLLKKQNINGYSPEYEDYFQYYEENFSGTWKKYFDTGIDTGLYTSGSVHFVFKDIILKNYLKILKSYKFIIYTRFDQKYTDFHPDGVENKILIPKGEDYLVYAIDMPYFPQILVKVFKHMQLCRFRKKFNQYKKL